MSPPGENQNPISETEKPQEEQRLEDEILGLQMRLLGIRDPIERKKIETSLSESQKNLLKLREERMERERSILQGGAGPEERAAQLLVRHLGRLEDLRDERETPPGFAQLPELSDEFKALEALSAEERFQILRATLSKKIEVEDERVRKQKEFLLLKLSYLQLLAEQLSKGRMFKSSKWSEQWASFLKSEPYTVKSWLQENSQDLIGKIMADEKFDLVAALPPNIKKILEKLSGKKLQDLKTKEAVYERYAAAIQAMRDDSDYEAAQQLMEELLADEFGKGEKKLGRAWIDQIRAQVARGKIFQLYVDQQNAWKKAGMNDKQIMDYYHELLRIEEEREVNKRVAQYILGSTVAIPREKRAIWEHYQDMLDPKHEWFNVSDEQWDTAMREIAINAPLILLSGGIASLARAGISRIGMSILERQGAKLLGREFFQQTVLSRALSRGIVWTAQKGGGMLVEGAVFDATHKALTGEQYHSLPDWAQSVIWSSISLGVFHGSGKISERLFTKHIGNLPVKTWLGAKLAHITIAPVREAAKVLLIKGHIEAAAMLFIGAVQNKAYTGSLQEFMDNIGNEILHAYITVGALKISGMTMRPIMRKLTLAPKQQRVELTRANRKEILDTLEDSKISRAEKQRIVEALEEHCGEELHPELYLGRIARELFPERFKDINVAQSDPAAHRILLSGESATEEKGREISEEEKKAPTLAKEHNLPALFDKARSLILQKIETTRKRGQKLSDEQKEMAVRKEWLRFLEKVERIRQARGKKFADSFMDFDAKFHEQAADRIDSWQNRTASINKLLLWSKITRWLPGKIRRITKEFESFVKRYDRKLARLPKEPVGENEKTKILRRIHESLTPAERALPEHEQKALVRGRFYKEMRRLSEIAGRVMDAMEAYAREHPKASMEEIIEEARLHGFDELPTNARKNMRIASIRLERNRAIMRTTLERFTPEEIFQIVTGHPPYGKVTLDMTSPFALHFILEPVDLARVYDRHLAADAPRAAIEAYLEKNPLRIGGCKLSSVPGLPFLDGLITFRRNDAQGERSGEIFTHEERHAMHHFFFSMGERMGKLSEHGKMAYENLQALYLKQKETSGDKRLIPLFAAEFPKILDQYRKSFLERAKDEIIAYLKDGSDPQQISQNLLDRGKEAIYDYPAEAKKSIVEGWMPWLSGIAGRLYGRMTEQYRREVKQAIHIVDQFLGEAVTPEKRNALLGELAVTPIEAWETLFIGKEKAHFGMIDFLNGTGRKRIQRTGPQDSGYVILDSFLDTVRDMGPFHPAEIVRLATESNFLQSFRHVLEYDFRQLNREEPQRKAHLKNVFAKQIQRLLDGTPSELALLLQKEILEALPIIEDPALQGALRKAVRTAEDVLNSEELRQAAEDFALDNLSVVTPESGPATPPDRPAAAVSLQSGIQRYANAVRTATEGTGEIILQATEGEMQALRSGNKGPLMARTQPYKDAGRALGLEVTATVRDVAPERGKIIILVKKATALDLTSEGLRGNARALLERVADKIIRIRDDLLRQGKSLHFPDILRELYQTTHSFKIPLPPDHPARQTFIGRVGDILIKHGCSGSADSKDINFYTAKVHDRVWKRKVYLTPPLEKMPEFLDALLAVTREHNLPINGKVHLEAINKDASGNITGVEQNLLPFYFTSDAHFQKFLEILPEVERRSGVTLDTFSTEALPTYLHAYGGKVRFGADLPEMRITPFSDATTQSYDNWSGAIFGAGIQAAMKSGTKESVLGAMSAAIAQKRPELKSPYDFLSPNP